MDKKMSFDKATDSLEDMMKSLESGALTLDESLDTFEEAVKLIKLCNEKLEGAKQRVRILTEGADSVITDLPFNVNEA